MPHVHIQISTGKTELQKQLLVDAIVNDLVRVLVIEEKTITVAREEIEPADWKEKVYQPEIIAKQEKLYKSRATRYKNSKIGK